MAGINTLLGVVAAGVVGGTLYLAATAQSTTSGSNSSPAATTANQPAAKPVGPPPGATFAPDEAAAVMNSIIGVRNPAQRDQIAAEWVDQWVPNAGWEGEVVDVKREYSEGGYSVRLLFSTGNQLTDFFVVCLVPDNDEDVRKGDRAKVQGRIDKVESLPGPAGTPTNRIVLRSGRVVQLIKMAPR
jgi:hypothetical protein